MKLQRLSASVPDFYKLNIMLDVMIGTLENRKIHLAIEEILSFQDVDGSFKLLDSYEVPSDARVDFCHIPTYVGAAILMREVNAGRRDVLPDLERALNASLHTKLSGHGYDSEKSRIDSMNIFIKGGLAEFLENDRESCPTFHQMIHNILHEYDACLLQGYTKGEWGENYGDDWRDIVKKLKSNKRIYAAYGSNMDYSQMRRRCHKANPIGKAYLEDWVLTMPFYANIEPADGLKTPALIWEITADDEEALDRCEGYPYKYYKTEVIVNRDGKRVSAMAYVMTDEYIKSGTIPRNNYEEQIKHGYSDAGFAEEEFMPKRSKI